MAAKPSCRRWPGCCAGRAGAAVGRSSCGASPASGKSRLLATVVDGAEDIPVLSAAGVQSESDLAFGALSALLLRSSTASTRSRRPGRLAARRGRPGRAALAGERLATFAAVVALPRGGRRSQPVLVVVDDLQWCDAASREAILFAARRLGCRPGRVRVRPCATARPRSRSRTGVPELRAGGPGAGAGAGAARRRRRAGQPRGRARLWAQTAGNPLALAEIPRHLSAEQRGGRLALSEPLPVGRRLEESFAATAPRLLPEAAAQALLVAAASYTGATDTIFAALELSWAAGATHWMPAEEEGLIAIADGVAAAGAIRSCARPSTTPPAAPARRAAHAALARAGGEARLPDHQAWHRAAAASAPDEGVAAALERVAEEALRRGAPGDRAACDRSAPRADARARPTGPGASSTGAEHALAVGRWDEALELLDGARGRTDDPRLRARGEVLRARVEMLRGNPHAAYDRLVAIAEAIAGQRPRVRRRGDDRGGLRPHDDGPDPRLPGHGRASLRARRADRRRGRGHRGARAWLRPAALGARPTPAWSCSSATATVAETSELWLSAPELYGMYACLYARSSASTWPSGCSPTIVANARERGAVRVLPYPLSGRALVDLHLGRWPAALAGAQEAVELSREMRGAGMLASSLAALAQVEACAGPGARRRAPTPTRAWPSARRSTRGRWSPSRCSRSPRWPSASASTRPPRASGSRPRSTSASGCSSRAGSTSTTS